MKAASPGDLPRLFLSSLNNGDVDAVVALYEEDGIVAADPNHQVRGHMAIRAMVAGFLSPKPQFALHSVAVVQAEDLALVRAQWTVATLDASGSPAEMKIGPALVTRRQPDGSWLVAVDRPLPGN